MAFSDTILSDLATVLADFGTVATWSKRDGTTASVTGIFDDAFQVVSPETLTMELTDPQFVCQTADVAELDKTTDTFTINSVDYYVVSNEPDGTGLTRLRLSKDRP